MPYSILVRLLVASVALHGALHAALLSALVGSPAGERDLRFETDATTLWVGRSHTLWFRVTTPAEEDRELTATIGDPALLELVAPPRLLAGRELGTLRVRALARGCTQIELEGARLDVALRAPREQARVAERRLRIVAPVDGAIAFGRCAVAVEVEPGAADALPAGARVELELGDGCVVPAEAVPGELTRMRRFVTVLDTDALPPGPLQLRAVLRDASGAALASPSIRVDVARAAPGALLRAECEVLAETERPQEFGAKLPRVGRAEDASGGRYVLLRGANRGLLVPVHVEQPARYQLALRARSEAAAGAHPTLAVCIDHLSEATVAGRLFDTRWHRTLIGAPFALEAGDHLLHLRFCNPADVPGYAHRDLYLDTLELLRSAEDVDAGAPATRATLPVNGGALLVAFERPLDGSVLNGRYELRGLCRWRSPERTGAPRVELRIDGRPVARTRGARPMFTLEPAAIDVGWHTLELRATLEDGSAHTTPPQRMWVPFELPARDPMQEQRDPRDVVVPRVELVHPRPGEGLFDADAIVAHALDDERVESAELVIDGVASGLLAPPTDGLGPIVLRFATRELATGEHLLALRVRDAAGNVKTSAPRTVRVLEQAPDEPTRYARAVVLLNRFAFGPEDSELADVLALGERAWLADRLRPFGARELAALDATYALQPDWTPTEVRHAALRHALRTANPVRARQAFWLDNHFSTCMTQTRPHSRWNDYADFARLASAPFVESLWTSVTSPAMLWYLDQMLCHAGALNENYARELLELHTLGIDGGYELADITALASLLTGLSVSEEAELDGRGLMRREFHFDPTLRELAARDALGVRFEEDPAEPAFERVRRVVELLATHPSTARHIARRLAEHYVSLPAPERLVDELARVYAESGGDLRALLLAIAAAPELFEPQHQTRVGTPLELALRHARAGGALELEPHLDGFLARCGMPTFERETPDGWPEGGPSWADSGVVIERWRLAAETSEPLVHLVHPSMQRQTDEVTARWRQRIVDTLALGLTGRVLGRSSNAAALELTKGGTPFVQRAAVFVAHTPEAGVR